MVCHKDRAQEVKALAQEVSEKHPKLILIFLGAELSWG